MSFQYAGNPASYPIDYTVPDDGNAENATSVNVAFEALGDRTAYLHATTSPLVDTLTAAAGTWTCPPTVTQILVDAVGGGGGGGGGGAGGNTATTTCSGGGGGGGGARRSRRAIAVTPGVVYAYTVGAGGAAGTAPAFLLSPGTAGGDGGDSTFNGVVVARGAQGGYAASAQLVTTAGKYAFVPGGTDVRMAGYVSAGARNRLDSGDPEMSISHHGGQGGAGSVAIGQFASEGGGSPDGFAGGALGAPGATSGSFKGGGGGGGGGAGGFGAGGAGGAGGAANSAGSASVGVAGTAGGANTGAGGGGGGAGGEGFSGGVAFAGAGGAGATGKILITYFGGVQAIFT